MSKAFSTISRRQAFGLGAGAVATAALASLPALGAVRDTDLTSPVASREELLSRYDAWLFMERRLLCMERWPEHPNPEDFVSVDAVARRFHFPDGRSWRDVPKPSTRAIAVLRAIGVPTAPSHA